MSQRRSKKKYALTRNYEPVGEYLRKMRLEADLTQKAVSEALGYSSSQFISNFECGIAVPPLKKLKVLMELYGMDVRVLLDLILGAEREVMLRSLGRKR